MKKILEKVKNFFKKVAKKVVDFFCDHEETIVAVGATALYSAVAFVWVAVGVYNKGFDRGYAFGNKVGYNRGIIDGCNGCMRFVTACFKNSIKDISDNNIGG